MDNGESSDPYCKLSMGKEKYKTKSIDGTVNPKWREAFDFNWFEEYDNEIEITIWDKDVGSKDDFMGRSVEFKIFQLVMPSLVSSVLSTFEVSLFITEIC